MSWCDESNHPFAGIAEKLKRADKNILDLQSEIADFFGSCKYPVIPDPNTKEWQEAVDYHRNLAIPLRFSVLSGEIVHHLRSCLDHVAWHFSSAQYRIDAENAIEFPVFRDEPNARDKRAAYGRKIKGVTNAKALQIIKAAQPYQRGCAAVDDPICIVHDMDRFDKHRELTIVMSCVEMDFPPGTNKDGILALVKRGKGETLSDAEFAAANKAIKKNPKVTPQVAFAQFGNVKTVLVIPALVQLKRAVSDLVNLFANVV